MKKYLLTVLVMAALVACNEKPQKVVDGTIEDSAVENVTVQDSAVVENVDANDINAAKNAEEAMKSMKEAAEKCSYVPTGDIEKDAEALVEKQLALALKDANGEDAAAEKQEVSGMLIKLGDFYSKLGKQDEFQKVLGEKMRVGIKKLKMEQLGS